MYFDKVNHNPKGLKAGDCVVRAIVEATGESWDDVYKALCELGLKMKRMPNNDKVWQKYIESRGFKKMPQPRKDDGKKYTVKEFLETKYWHKEPVLMRVAHHLTCGYHWALVDTWDCSYKCVGNYWVKKYIEM